MYTLCLKNNTILLLQQQDQCCVNFIYLGAEILSVIQLLKYLTSTLILAYSVGLSKTLLGKIGNCPFECY